MTNPHDVFKASKKTSKKQKPPLSADFYADVFVKGQKLPDPKKHQLVSFLKSGIRIAGYVALFFSIETAAVLLIVSELVGIYEELV
jgi:hypothetical protein